MNKYLAIYGKPRYLGLVEYDGDIKKGAALIVESVRGEELAVAVGEINAEQEAATACCATPRNTATGWPKIPNRW